MKRILIIITILAASGMAYSQSALKKLADKSFEKQDFQTAAASYERLVQKGDSSFEILFKLGDAYYFNANYLKANAWYVKGYNQSKQLTANQFHHFIQTLKSVGNKEESNRVMDAFSKAFPQDLRVKNNVNSEKYFQNPLQVSIKNLTINSAYSDYGASLYKDSLVFSSARPTLISSLDYYRTDQPFTNLFVATKSDSIYSHVSLLKKEVTYSAFHEATPVFTKDGKTMYYTKNELKNNKINKALDGLYKLYKAVYENGKWVDKGMIAIAGSDGARIAHPTLSLDEKTLYFAAEMKQGFGQSDIYSIALNSDGSVGLPINLGAKINSEGRESYPFITENNLLIFASDGHPGYGGFDLFALDLKNETAPIINLGSIINSPEDDFNFVQKTGANEGVFSSNRIGGKGDDDLYSFIINKPFEVKPLVFIAGIVSDQTTGKPLANSTVVIKDEAGIVLATIVTDDKGAYIFEALNNKNYIITYNNNGFDEVKQSVNIPISVQGTVQANAKLIKPTTIEKNSFGITCLVTDSKSHEALDSVEIIIIDRNTNKEIIKKITLNDGTITELLAEAKLKDVLAYKIVLKKTGYFTKVVEFTKQLTEPGIIKLHEELDFSLTKIEEGMDLAKVFNINPIYFDLNKFNIRPDAAIELNKIIAIMNDNPTLIVELGSHTDCRSSIAYNEKLSDNRAKASAAYIRAKISRPERIYGKGYGESQLITNCPCEGTVKSTCSEKEHQLNRRTEFKIIKF